MVSTTKGGSSMPRAICTTGGPKDAANFKRADCVSDQYARYTVIDDIKINSKLTLGEDLADLAALCWPTLRGNMRRRAGTEAYRRVHSGSAVFIGMAQWAAETSALKTNV